MFSENDLLLIAVNFSTIFLKYWNLSWTTVYYWEFTSVNGSRNLVWMVVTNFYVPRTIFAGFGHIKIMDQSPTQFKK